MRNQNQPVAFEGYPFIALTAFVTLVFAGLGWTLLTLVSLLLTLFVVYFFRNPERVCPEDENALVAPADGKVIFVGKVKEPDYFKTEVTKVSIFMNVFNVHINRVPTNGKVLKTFVRKGEFFNAALDKASLENEQAGMLLEVKGRKKLLVVQIAGLVARRIISYPEVGDKLERGMRYGLIRFGSRVDLYFPDTVDVLVSEGDVTVAGESIIGRFV